MEKGIYFDGTKDIRGIKVDTTFSEQNYYKKSITELYDIAEKLAPEYREKYPKLAKGYILKAIKIDDITRKHESNAWLAFYKLPFLIISALILNYFLNRKFPHGIFFAAVPNLNFTTFISEKTAGEHIRALEKHRNDLNKKAGEILFLVLLLSVSLIPTSLIFFFLANSYSPVLTYVCLSLFSIASINLVQHYIEYEEKKQFKTMLERKNKLFKSLIPDEKNKKVKNDSFPVSVGKQENGSTLQQNYFEFTFSSYKGISARSIRKLFAHCLRRHDVSVAAESSENLYIQADTIKDNTQVQKVKNLFQKALDRRLNSNKLYEQCSSFMKLLVDEEEVTFVSSYDASDLPICQWKFNLPKDTSREILGLLETTFPATTIQESGQELLITIKDIQPTDKNIFSEAYAKLNAIIKEQNRPTNVENQYESKEHSTKNNIRRRPLGSIATTETTQPDPETKPLIIRWPSGTYNSTEEKYSIQPFIRSKIHNTQSLQRTKHFVCTELRRDQFPNEEYYQSHLALVEHPNIVGKNGGQGSVFYETTAVDQNGKRFTSSLKGRIYGAGGKGDMRLFARKEVATTGQVLHIYCALGDHKLRNL